MTVVDDPWAGEALGEAPAVSPGGSGSGGGFAWYPADPAPGFDPVTDVAVGADAGIVGPEWIAAAVEHCAQGLSMLEALDPGDFDAATTAAWANGVEQLRRQTHAAAIAVADHLDVAQPFRDLGFFTAKAWMKHHLQLSGAEAHGRVQEARLRQAVAVWNNALAAGQVGVAQTRLMARIAANPRIDPDVLVRGVWELLVDAMDLPYIEFERRALTFEMLADPDGTAEKLERNQRRRTANIAQNPDGSWSLHALIDDVGGPEFLEIFCWYVDREFDADWKEATHRLGDGNVDISQLRRTEPQRRADALLAMARAAAANPPGRTRPLPCVNFLLDEHTANAVADGNPLDPSNYRNVTSRTDRGHPINPNAIIGVSLWALIRRVVTRRPRCRHRHGPHPTTLQRPRPRRRHAARTHLRLARLRPTPHLVPRRPPHQLDHPWPHQHPQRRTPVPPPQLRQRAGLHHHPQPPRPLAHHRTRRHHHLLTRSRLPTAGLKRGVAAMLSALLSR